MHSRHRRPPAATKRIPWTAVHPVHVQTRIFDRAGTTTGYESRARAPQWVRKNGRGIAMPQHTISHTYQITARHTTAQHFVAPHGTKHTTRSQAHHPTPKSCPNLTHLLPFGSGTPGLTILGIAVAVVESVMVEIDMKIFDTINKICTEMAVINQYLRGPLVKIHIYHVNEFREMRDSSMAIRSVIVDQNLRSMIQYYDFT